MPANTFVPSLAFISQDRIGRLRKTNPHERGFMEKVVEANLKLAEGYLGSAQGKDVTDARNV